MSLLGGTISFVAASLAISLPPIMYRVYVDYLSFRRRENDAIRKAEELAKKEPLKAKPAWDLVRVTMEAYFRRNLSQVNTIFWVSSSVMLCGFIVMIGGILIGFHDPTGFPVATLTAASGILTQFIGATFLFVYRSVSRQASVYFQTLERMNAVGMAMSILDSIPDDSGQSRLKGNTKSRIIELLVSQELSGLGERPERSDVDNLESNAFEGKQSRLIRVRKPRRKDLKNTV